jgi:hypothetical protein
MEAIPIAHSGHWALWILYLLPIIVVGIAIVTSVIRGRREEEAEDAG